MRNLVLSLLAGAASAVASTSAGTQVAATHPYPGGLDADIWILAGQSNMQGAGVITGQYVANPKVMMFGLDNEWIPAVPPTHRVFTAAAPVFKKLLFARVPDLTEERWEKSAAAEKVKPTGGLGPDLSFAESIVNATGRPVGLVPCALGATSMADWNPAGRELGGESLYGNMIDRIESVGGRIKGVLWYQGESDAMDKANADAFTETFLNIVDSIRRDTGLPDLPFIYVQISRYCLQSRESEPYWQTVQEKQRTAAAQRKNLWVVPAIDLPLDDLIHIGAEGQKRLGRRMAGVALTFVYQIKGHGTPIDFAACEILPATDVLHHRMRVRFSGVTGRLQAQGRPVGFRLQSDDANKDGPMVYKVEFDPEDPSAVIVWYSKAITSPVRLSYGLGMDPYVNITDSVDMAVPAFGPVTVQPLP